MTFKVGLTSDLSNGKGGFSWGDISIGTLAPLVWEFIYGLEKNFRPKDFIGRDAIAFAAPGVDKESFRSAEDSPLILARFGVGYDNIDLAACTEAGVCLTITPDGSKKPVATAALTYLLAVTHNLIIKNKRARENRWDNRLENLGRGINGKTIATIGLGNIGTEFFRLLEPFDCKRIAYDPWVKKEHAKEIGVELLELEELLKIADAVVVLAVLTPDTHHLLNRNNLKLMKSNAVIINISRGPIIEEAALIEVLKNNVIAGAGLDVFEIEPTTSNNELLKLENVIITPHNIAWTDELAFGMGRSAFNSIKAISQGEVPNYVVNKDVLETEQFKKKLAKFKR